MDGSKAENLTPEVYAQVCPNCNGRGTVGYDKRPCPTCGSTNTPGIVLVPIRFKEEGKKKDG